MDYISNEYEEGAICQICEGHLKLYCNCEDCCDCEDRCKHCKDVDCRCPENE